MQWPQRRLSHSLQPMRNREVLARFSQQRAPQTFIHCPKTGLQHLNINTLDFISEDARKRQLQYVGEKLLQWFITFLFQGIIYVVVVLYWEIIHLQATTPKSSHANSHLKCSNSRLCRTTKIAELFQSASPWQLSAVQGDWMDQIFSLWRGSC